MLQRFDELAQPPSTERATGTPHHRSVRRGLRTRSPRSKALPPFLARKTNFETSISFVLAQDLENRLGLSSTTQPHNHTSCDNSAPPRESLLTHRANTASPRTLQRSKRLPRGTQLAAHNSLCAQIPAFAFHNNISVPSPAHLTLLPLQLPSDHPMAYRLAFR